MADNPHLDRLLAARALDNGDTAETPVAYRWKHERDEVWKYGQQPKHLLPPRGKELIGYYAVQPLYSDEQMRAATVAALKRLLGIVPANLPYDAPYRPVNLGWSQCAEFMRGAIEDAITRAEEGK
jgi:hypothetical protein